MACCLIAVFLVAQLVAMLRRWAVFWGVLPVPDGETPDTAMTRMAAFLARPRIRQGVAALIACELVLLGGWVTLAHGDHIAELADIGWSRIHGEQVVYAGICNSEGDRRLRLVLNDSQRQPTAFN